MPIVNQFSPASSGYKGPAEQLLYASLIGFSRPGRRRRQFLETYIRRGLRLWAERSE